MMAAAPTKPLDQQLASQLLAALRSGPPLRLAMLFGSGAARSLRSDSDIDLAILPEDAGLSLADELRLQVELTRA